jgi:hypothetical protein
MSGIWGSFSFEHCSHGNACTAAPMILLARPEHLGRTISNESPFTIAGSRSARVGMRPKNDSEKS